MAAAKRPKAQSKTSTHYKDAAFRKEGRLGLRIKADEKALLEDAARELGVPLSEFVLSAALERAHATLKK